MSAIDDLTTVPAQPEISEGNKTFSQKTYALYVWIRTRLVPAMIELRDLIVNSVTGAFSGTSSTSVTIVDTGEVSIATDTGRSFKPGTPVRLANVADPRIYIDGITKTYNASTGALAFYAQAKAGSGTYTSWSLTIIPSGGGLAGLGSNTFVGSQFVPDDPYDATNWNGSAAVPTKNAIRDKIESLLSTIKNAANDSLFASTSSSDLTSPEWVYGLLSRLCLGIGQTVQNVTSLRAVNTTYTNTSGRPILVSVHITQSAGGSASLQIDGGASYQSGNISGASISLVGVVPSGSTYRVVPSAGSWTLLYWTELRV